MHSISRTREEAVVDPIFTFHLDCFQGCLAWGLTSVEEKAEIYSAICLGAAVMDKIRPSSAQLHKKRNSESRFTPFWPFSL
jgi:hypothetical protein